MERLDPRTLHFCVVTCPCCLRRMRASSLLRAWEANPAPTFADAENMVAKSNGPGTLRNERAPLWDVLKLIPDVRTRITVTDRVGAFFRCLESRLRDGAQASNDAAYRARWG